MPVLCHSCHNYALALMMMVIFRGYYQLHLNQEFFIKTCTHVIEIDDFVFEKIFWRVQQLFLFSFFVNTISSNNYPDIEGKYSVRTIVPMSVLYEILSEQTNTPNVGYVVNWWIEPKTLNIFYIKHIFLKKTLRLFIFCSGYNHNQTWNKIR